jgi:hypothetical protein
MMMNREWQCGYSRMAIEMGRPREGNGESAIGIGDRERMRGYDDWDRATTRVAPTMDEPGKAIRGHGRGDPRGRPRGIDLAKSLSDAEGTRVVRSVWDDQQG